MVLNLQEMCVKQIFIWKFQRQQWGVLSPLLFTVYLDQLTLALKELSIDCYLNGMFVGAFIYADDITLLAPTSMALKAMLNK